MGISFPDRMCSSQQFALLSMESHSNYPFLNGESFDDGSVRGNHYCNRDVRPLFAAFQLCCGIDVIVFALFLDAKASGYNILMDYRMAADVPAPYYGICDTMRPVDKSVEKDPEVLASAFVSNCGATNNRQAVLAELMGYIKVDSFGMCHHNKVGENNNDKLYYARFVGS